MRRHVVLIAALLFVGNPVWGAGWHRGQPPEPTGQETAAAPILITIAQAAGTEGGEDYLLEVRRDGLVRYAGALLVGGFSCGTCLEEIRKERKELGRIDLAQPPISWRASWKLSPEQLESVVVLVGELGGIPWPAGSSTAAREEQELKTLTFATASQIRVIAHAIPDETLPEQMLKIEGALERATLLGRRFQRRRDWVSRHQEDDGGWRVDGLPASCNPFFGESCGGNGDPSLDGAVTALFLLTFLCAGHHNGAPSPYTGVVTDALRHLESDHEADAGSVVRLGKQAALIRATRSLATSKALAANSTPQLRRFATSALALLMRVQREDGAFAQSADDPQDAVASTGWALLALLSARAAGIETDALALERARHWLHLAWVPAAGNPTALAVDLLIGSIRNETVPERPLAALIDSIEAMKAAPETADLEFLLFASITLSHVGDQGERLYKAVKPLLIDVQKREGCANGSWDPRTTRDLRGGRAWTTALATLCLQIYYRFPRSLARLKDGGTPKVK